jgi:hypothetical protein
MPDEKKGQHLGKSQSEDSLIHFMVVLLKYKWLIVSFVALVFVSSLLRISLHNSKLGSDANEQSAIPSSYSSECVIEPNGVSADKLKAVLASRNLTTQILEKSTMMKDFPLEFVDEKNLQQPSAKPPTQAELRKIIQGRMEIKSEHSIVKISCRGSDKEFPRKMLDEYISGASDFLRAQDSSDVKDQIAFIQKKIAAARNEQIKARLADQLMDLFDRERRVNGSRYYGFRIIDQPSAAESVLTKDPASTPKPLSKWSMVPLLIASFIVALTLAFLIEYIKALKTRNPEQFNTLKKYMKLR